MKRHAFHLVSLGASAVALLSAGAASAAEVTTCARTLRASVVALDQPMWVNRMGAARPGGMVFALAEDVVSTGPGPELRPGQVQLRPGKRPRPIVLRLNLGDCLDLHFRNLLAPKPVNSIQPLTRQASIHVTGLAVRGDISSDGTAVGANPVSGVVPPGQGRTYKLYAAAEGSSLLYSTPGDYNGFATMQVNQGLFGAVNVEPAQSEWYRSQVSEEDLRLATRGWTDAKQPLLDYDAVFPPGHALAGRPILRMLDATGAIRHTDLTAVVTGPGRGPLPGGPGTNPILPERDRPFREVTIHYHEAQDVVQAFPQIYALTEQKTFPVDDAGYDAFAINYGTAGIAAEVLSNRLGTGPAAACADCKFEEFFLSSWVLGDPGLLVDVPANVQGSPKATRAFFPDDPSNVYHSYLGDHVRFRVLHAGASVHHVHHHHAHQWLFSAEDEGSNYLDSQSIGPGSSFSAELVYHGSGNRNLTAGDSIFHCHFYPHFASGMWALYRVHDVFEAGTPIEDGRPKPGSRALPDGEIAAGTPIPAVVPIPTTAMPPMPAPVSIVDGQVKLPSEGFPGYPFFIPGIAGHRAPHPPLDFAVDPKTRETHDGGLPRHVVTAGLVGNNQFNTLDWSKDLVEMDAFRLPEEGTPAEKGAMRFHGQHLHASFTPEGKPAQFRVNGLPRGPQPGAPFADPGVVDGRAVGGEKRVYKGVNLQLDAVFNKAGWHFPQQRLMALWDDVPDLVSGAKPPEPLFFRAHAGDVVEYWHTNLVPAYYELDDFQVRTPTDILGQHIHLVKFDVTSSDGAANGWNYEDGTFSPEEVRERIEAINALGGLRESQAGGKRVRLEPKGIPALGLGPGGSWLGAQATVQRWWVDPLAAPQMTDRTYMTVFTHDHFGPSTHQMVGLYGGLLVEPAGTTWTSPDGKVRYRTRHDGGPTGFAANVLYDDPLRAKDNYREFALAWGDTASPVLVDPPTGEAAVRLWHQQPHAARLLLLQLPGHDLRPGPAALRLQAGGHGRHVPGLGGPRERDQLHQLRRREREPPAPGRAEPAPALADQRLRLGHDRHELPQRAAGPAREQAEFGRQPRGRRERRRPVVLAGLDRALRPGLQPPAHRWVVDQSGLRGRRLLPLPGPAGLARHGRARPVHAAARGLRGRQRAVPPAGRLAHLDARLHAQRPALQVAALQPQLGLQGDPVHPAVGTLRAALQAAGPGRDALGRLPLQPGRLVRGPGQRHLRPAAQLQARQRPAAPGAAAEGAGGGSGLGRGGPAPGRPVD